jgi:hypothetical protein
MRLTRAVAFVRSRFFPLSTNTRTPIQPIAFTLLFLCFSASLHAATAESGSRSLLLPLTFEPNRGQAPSEALYLARGAEGSVLLGDNGVVALLGGGRDAKALRIRFAGSALRSRATPEDPTGGIANYYGRGKRLENVPLYSRVRFKDVYAGTDVIFHGRTGRLEYDFELAPSADPESIVIDVSAADSVTLQSDNSLLLTLDGRHTRMLPPEAFQEINGNRVVVDVSYRTVGSHQVKFELGKYDATEPLTIDPVVAYTTVLNVNNGIYLHDAFADSAGNLYFAGETSATNYPVTVGGSPTDTHDSAFITKLDPTGSTILVSTILEFAGASAIATDSSGNLYMAGWAYPGFTATTGPIATCGNPCGGFAAKFNSSGQLTYATLVSTGQVMPHAIAADSNGYAYLTGIATDDSLATVNAFQPEYQGSICTSCSNAFFAKLNPDGTEFEFASYFGGFGIGKSISLDQNGNIYIAGDGGVPLVNPLQLDVGGIFVSKFASNGKTLLFSTQFGGSGDTLAGMALGTDGTVYLAGNTASTQFPYTLNAYRLPTLPSHLAPSNMFAAAIKPDLSGLTYSTYLGQGFINTMKLASDGRIFVAGLFHTEPLPLKNPVVSDNDSGGFVLSLDKTGLLSSASQFGGYSLEQVPDVVALDSGGNIYLAGRPGHSYSWSARAFTIDPVNIGTGDRYLAQQLYGSLHYSGYSTFISKIAPTNAPQVSFSVYLPSMVLRNVGSAVLNLQNLAVGTGTSKATSCGSSLSAGASCIVTIAPFGTVTISSNAQPTSQSFVPVPNSDQEAVKLWPDRGLLYFGLQQRGNIGNTQSFRLWNVTTAPVAITAVSTTGAVSQTNNCPASLDPSTFCTIQVSLTSDPLAEGGSVNIAASSLNLSIPAAIHFTTKPIAVSTAGISFGRQVVGKPSLYRTVTITNTSNGSISLSNTLTGASEFSIAGTTCTATLAAHASCAVALEFTPTISGSRSAELSVSGGGSSTKVGMSGSGAMDSVVKASPLGLEFYNAIIGRKTYPQPVTLTNTSGSPVSVTAVEFSSPDYVQTNTCQASIPPAGTCQINVSMQPQDLVNANSTMTVSFDHAADQVLSIVGRSVWPIHMSPTSLDAGPAIPVGQTRGMGTLYLANSYGLQESVSYTLSVTGDFRLTNNLCPNPLPPHFGCSVNLAFEPTVPGPHQGSLNISYPDLAAKASVVLTGTAASPGITISPSELGFGDIMMTTKSAPKFLTLSNAQTFPVTIPGPAMDGDQFEVSHSCSTIQPGATCNVSIVFAPTTTGYINNSVAFQNGGTPPTAYTIRLQGRGIPLPGLTSSTTTHNFNGVDVGKSSAPFVLRITNSGAHPVGLPPLTISGTNAADFAATPSAACGSIASQDSCDVQVVFSPKASAVRRASLSFPSGGVPSEEITVSLEGTGWDFAVGPAGTEQLTKSIASGQTATFNLKVQRLGHTGELQIQCAANGLSYGTCSANPTMVPASSTDSTVTISIGPVAAATTAQPSHSSWQLALAMLLPGLVLFARTRRTRKIPGILILAACLAGILSCGGGGGGSNPPPSYQTTAYRYTVTFLGSASHSVNLTVNVSSKL